MLMQASYENPTGPMQAPALLKFVILTLLSSTASLGVSAAVLRRKPLLRRICEPAGAARDRLPHPVCSWPRRNVHVGRSCSRPWGKVSCSHWVVPSTNTYFPPFPGRNGGSYTGSRDLRASPRRRVRPELRAASSRAAARFRVSRALLSRAAAAGVSRPVARS
jgi:hypothetical protein